MDKLIEIAFACLLFSFAFGIIVYIIVEVISWIRREF
jgi:phage shock protein PspC (stress-responsive transcriptional regulator)